MNILEKIVDHKREEVANRRHRVRISALEDVEFFHRTPSSLTSALGSGRRFGIIAEIKKASPSAGLIRGNTSVGEIASLYEANGAAALSVLTDERFFLGSLDDLQEARSQVHLPILRKDFVIDEYQIFEAKAFGADAILLIAAILDRKHLSDLHVAASEMGLDCLVELYDESEIDTLDFDRMPLVGVNNRNLQTLEVDIRHSLSIARLLPRNLTIVSESGIRTVEDLKQLRDGGIQAALVGESLMASENPGLALKELLDGLDT